MDGWINGWMDGWMDGQTDRQIDGCRVYGKTDIQHRAFFDIVYTHKTFN